MKLTLNGPLTIASLMILGLTLPTWSQSAPQAMPGATLVHGGGDDPGALLGNEFKDEAQGFRITPPLAARVTSRQGLDLVSFVVEERGWGGSLQRVDIKINSLDDYANAVVDELSRSRTIKDAQGHDVPVKTFRGVEIKDKTTTKVGDYNAVKLALSLQADITNTRGQPDTLQLYRQQLIVQTAEDKSSGEELFYVLTFYSPLQDKTNATRVFEAVASSLQLFDPKQMADKRRKALEAGQKWLEQRTAEELKAKMLTAPQLFRVIVGGAGGTEVGVTKFEEVEANRDGQGGMEVHVASQIFRDDHTLVNQDIAFWAYSKAVDPKTGKVQAVPSYSVWDNINEEAAKVKSARDPKQLVDKTFWNRESGILTMEANTKFTDEDLKDLEEKREESIRLHPDRPPPPEITAVPRQYHLIVKLDGDDAQSFQNSMKSAGALDTFQTGAGGAAAVANSALDIKIPPEAGAPLFKALEFNTWTRFVDVKVPSEMSFVVYNSSLQKPDLCNLIVTGRKETITVDGQPMECWRLVQEIDPGSTTLWVDSNGIIKCMRTSDQTVLAPTTLDAAQRKWGAKLDAHLKAKI